MKKMEPENCGPGCDCGKPSGNTKAKAVICLIVLLAIGGIFVYRTTITTPASNMPAAFAAPVANDINEANQVNEASEGNKSNEANEANEPNRIISTVDQQTPAAEPAQTDNTVGQLLDSLSSLEKVAVDLDAAFIFFPDRDSDMVSKDITDAIASAEQKIKDHGINLGIYTLQSDSPEYDKIADKLNLPCMLIMSKGYSIGVVSGEITENKILRAYITSTTAVNSRPSDNNDSEGYTPTTGSKLRKL